MKISRGIRDCTLTLKRVSRGIVDVAVASKDEYIFIWDDVIPTQPRRVESMINQRMIEWMTIK